MRGLRTSVTSAAAVLLLSGTAAPAAIAAEAVAERQAASTRLLDVPFISQTEDLCGGAALAMVLRYWGERQVYPEDFAPLVDRSAAGIRTDVLAEAVRQRGWKGAVLDASAGGAALMVPQLERGRPMVALIEVRPNRYHYVVVVAWTAERVVVHDPAQAPFRVLAHDEFDRAWSAAGRWALLILPGPATPEPSAPVRPVDGTATPVASACAALLPALVAQATSGDLEGAERGLLAATAVCPEDAAPWRELAGIRFLQSRWDEAATLAARAARLAPDDAQGLDLLATSRFLSGAPDDALAVWNRIGRPTVDLVRVEGAEQTRHPLITSLVGLPPRTLLTPERYALAARRLQALPSAALTRLRYRPTTGGLAELDAAVVERPTVPRGAVPLVALAARTAIQRELRLDVAAPTGSGELWSAAWRWWEARPRVTFGLAVPAVPGLPGVVSVQGLWEHASYAVVERSGSGDASRVVRQERRRASFGLADWATGRLRWTAGAAMDRWDDDSHAAVDAGLEMHVAGDRVAFRLDAAAWTPIGSGRRFATSAASVALRSTTASTRPQWSAVGGLSAATSASPYDLWPGAGVGLARTPLLRAHPLLDDGVVTGVAFGRQLAHASLEYQHPLATRPIGTLLAAAFLDTARAWRGTAGRAAGQGQVDVGAGLRVALPGAVGTLRLDLARGLADGRMVLSAGWLTAWAGR